jgi:hypothetical protein
MRRACHATVMTRVFPLIGWAVLALTAAGCVNNDPDLVPGGIIGTPMGATSLQRDVQPIFNVNCALSGCHAGSLPQAGLNLEPGQAYANLVGASGTGVPSLEVPELLRVDPGNSAGSYLINKVEGTDQQVGGPGTRMPLGLPPLPDSTIQVMRDWIDQGALDN